MTAVVLLFLAMQAILTFNTDISVEIPVRL